MHKRFLRREAGLLVALCLCLGAAGPASAQRPKAKTRTAPAAAEESVARNVKYRVEIGGDASPETTVIMAVGQVTAFKCPEPVLGVAFGNRDGITVEEGGAIEAALPARATEGGVASASAERVPSSIFYIRPTKAGVRTNMFIEMPSGIVGASVRSVSPETGLQAGTFNKEVYVRKFGYRDELAQLSADKAGLQAELAAAKDRLSATARETEAKIRQAQAAADRMVVDEALSLVAASDLAAATDWLGSEKGRRERDRLVKELKRKKSAGDSPASTVLIQMYGEVRQAASGRLYATFVVENLGTDRLELTKATGEAGGDRVEVAGSATAPPPAPSPLVTLAAKSPKVIEGGGRGVITLAVEGLRQNPKGVTVIFHFLPPVGMLQQTLLQ